MTEFTLVLQGKLHANTIKMCNLQKHIRTIISTWGTMDDAVEFIGSALRPNLTIVARPLPALPQDSEKYNESNRLYHFTSTFNGLELVPTEFVIKARTDEYYTDLSPLTKMVLKEPEKIITNNVFFRKTSIYKFHPSDHLLAGRTRGMLKLFKEAKTYCERNMMSPTDIRPEQMLGSMYVAQNESKIVDGFRPNFERGSEVERETTRLMKKYFNVINSNQLGEFEVKANSLKGVNFWHNTEYANHKVDVVDSMEEL